MISLARNNKGNGTDYIEHDDINTEMSDDFADESILQDNDYTLESILAEFKGSAYIDGDKKTPSSVLQEKTDRIVKEAATGRIEIELPEELKQPAREREPETKQKTDKLPKRQKSGSKKSGVERPPEKLPGITDRAAKDSLDESATKKLPDINAVNKAKINEYQAAKNKSDDAKNDQGSDSGDVIAFDSYTGSGDDAEEDIIREVTKAIEQQTQFEQETKKSAKKAFGIFKRNGEQPYEDDVYDSGYEEPVETYEPPSAVFEDTYVEEPDFNIAIKKFAEKCNMYSTRCFASLSLSVLLTILTIIFQAGVSLPFGIGVNTSVCAGILLILMFVVMMFSAEKLVDGFADIIKGKQGVDTLNLFSCLATAGAGIFGMMTKDATFGMPFCAVSAFSLTFTLWGERVYYRALTETLRAAQSTSMPIGVVVAMCTDIDRSVIKKTAGKTAGFYNNMIQEDVTETVFRYATPILIIAAIVLAFLSSFALDQRQYFTHNFAAVMAAAAPFSAVLAYAVPFNTITKKSKQSGVSVAGWGGADELYHSDGASIKDEDIFPEGTVSLGGIKIFEEVQPDKAIRYTASLIIASDSVLSSLFTQLLLKQGLTKLSVSDFSCYEGGIGGEIKGERIVTGSAALMNLLGIRVPPSLNMKNGVFTAVDKKLIAVFTIDYVPVKTVQNALVTVLKNHVKLLFSVRDFNITPVMLEQKFKVPVDDVEYIPIQDTYDLSDDGALETKRTAAVLTREGIGAYVDAIVGGRRLRFTALFATILTLLSAVGGMVIMYSINLTGAFTAGSAANLLLYMSSMLAVVLIVCGFARYR